MTDRDRTISDVATLEKIRDMLHEEIQKERKIRKRGAQLRVAKRLGLTEQQMSRFMHGAGLSAPTAMNVLTNLTIGWTTEAVAAVSDAWPADAMAATAEAVGAAQKAPARERGARRRQVAGALAMALAKDDTAQIREHAAELLALVLAEPAEEE